MNEAELVFTQILNCDRTSLYLNRNSSLVKNKLSLVPSIFKRRIHGEPSPYILGKTEFMGLEFKVSPDVFIPRQETEILVETVMKCVAGYKSQVTSKRILDVGTGCGCVAISLAKLLSNVNIMATDISKKALRVATFNANLHKVQINFVQSDLFTCYLLRATCYNIIVSNPPYIPTEEIDDLQPEIRHEPRIALDGGKDGFDFYRRIIKESPHYLKKGGFLIMEIGYNQRKDIENIFRKQKIFAIIGVIKDYNNIERVIVAQKY